jgi:hypothetical protein
VRGAREGDVGLLAVDQLDAVVGVDGGEDAADGRALGRMGGDGVGVVEWQWAAAGVEGDGTALAAVEVEDDAPGGVGFTDGAGSAVGEAAGAVGAAELDAVAGGQLAGFGAREVAAAQAPGVVVEAGAVAVALDGQGVALGIDGDDASGVAGANAVGRAARA